MSLIMWFSFFEKANRAKKIFAEWNSWSRHNFCKLFYLQFCDKFCLPWQKVTWLDTGWGISTPENMPVKLPYLIWYFHVFEKSKFCCINKFYFLLNSPVPKPLGMKFQNFFNKFSLKALRQLVWRLLLRWKNVLDWNKCPI